MRKLKIGKKKYIYFFLKDIYTAIKLIKKHEHEHKCSKITTTTMQISLIKAWCIWWWRETLASFTQRSHIISPQRWFANSLLLVVQTAEQRQHKDEPLCNSHRKPALRLLKKCDDTHHEDDACVFFFKAFPPVSSWQSKHVPADCLYSYGCSYNVLWLRSWPTKHPISDKVMFFCSKLHNCHQ